MKNIFGILAVLLLSGITFAGLTITEYSLSQDAFKPGSRGIVTLYISNPSACPGLAGGCTEDHRLTDVSVSTYPPSAIAIDSTVAVGDIETGASSFVSLPFTIADDTTSGIYRLDFRIYSFGETSQTRRITIPITVADLPEFVFTPDVNVLTSVDSIDLMMSNNGGIAKNLKIKITDDAAGVALFGTNEIYVGDLEDEATVNMMLDSRSASDGPVNVPFIVMYEDEIGVSHEETNYVRMTVKKEALDIVFEQESDVVTKEEGTLVLSIVNTGDEELKDVKLSFTDSDLKLRGRNEMDFGDIAVGGKSTVSATVFATFSPGLNLVPAEITWTEKDVNKEEQLDVPLTISSDADVGVYIETKPAPLTVGEEHTLSVLVSNLGSYRIDNVDVELKSDILETLDISNKQYIGSLENDDFSTVQFKTRIGSSVSPGDYTMKIEIDYRDQSGEWKTKTITQPITVNAMQADEGGIFNLLLPVAVVLVLVWYFFLRKRGKKKPE